MAAVSESVAQKVKIPSSYTCSITGQIMIDPVFTSDGHTYEREAIEEWLKTHDTSPKTNLKLKHKELIGNHDKRGDILGFLEQRLELYERDEVYLPKAWISELIAAIKANKMKEVQECLKKDRRLLTMKLKGDYTAFHLACQFGSADLANILLENLTKRDAFDKILRQSPVGFKPVYLNVVLKLQEQARRLEEQTRQIEQQVEYIVRLEKELAQMKQRMTPEQEVKEKSEGSSTGAPITLQFQAQLKPAPKVDVKVTAEEVQKFLNYVAAGEQNKAESMLKKNRDLVLATGTVTDHAKRTFKNITGFQYAVWALDWQMWEMIRKYLSKEAAQEQARGFSEGFWVKEHREYVNWKKLTDAQQALMANWDPWNWEKIWEKTNECWQQMGIRGAQGLLPVHVLQEYNQPNRPFAPCPKFDADYVLTRSNSRWLAGLRGGVLRGDMPTLLQLPNIALRIASDEPSQSDVYVGVCIHADCQALITLFSTRTQQRAELVAELGKGYDLRLSKRFDVQGEPPLQFSTSSSSSTSLPSASSSFSIGTQQQETDKQKKKKKNKNQK